MEEQEGQLDPLRGGLTPEQEATLLSYGRLRNRLIGRIPRIHEAMKKNHVYRTDPAEEARWGEELHAVRTDPVLGPIVRRMEAERPWWYTVDDDSWKFPE